METSKVVSASACVQIAMRGTGIALAAKQIITQSAATVKVNARRPSEGLFCLLIDRRAIMNPWNGICTDAILGTK